MNPLDAFDLPEPKGVGDHIEIGYLLAFLEGHIDKISSGKTSLVETKLNCRLANEYLLDCWPQIINQHEENKF